LKENPKDRQEKRLVYMKDMLPPIVFLALLASRQSALANDDLDGIIFLGAGCKEPRCFGIPVLV
jgi:hypothetical protein